ncbi:MAG: GNAT family N-acetyltransferase [Caldilineaceae bacterium]
MPITVRQATPEDAGEIARLNATVDDLRATPEQIAAQITACAGIETMFLAEVDGHVAGMVSLRLLPNICDPIPYAELTELFVEAAYRRLGVGRALVERIEQEAKQAGATQLVLVTAFKNSRAHAFYHVLGYAMYLFAMHKRFEP